VRDSVHRKTFVSLSAPVLVIFWEGAGACFGSKASRALGPFVLAWVVDFRVHYMGFSSWGVYDMLVVAVEKRTKRALLHRWLGATTRARKA